MHCSISYQTHETHLGRRRGTIRVARYLQRHGPSLVTGVPDHRPGNKASLAVRYHLSYAAGDPTPSRPPRVRLPTRTKAPSLYQLGTTRAAAPSSRCERAPPGPSPLPIL